MLTYISFFVCCLFLLKKRDFPPYVARLGGEPRIMLFLQRLGFIMLLNE